MSVFIDYYKQELRTLYESAADFSKRHPSVAGMLQEPSVDPDVERILQGVAFLTADIRRKLDDEFPELAQSMAQTICPQYLRPAPAVTMMALSPRDNLKQTLTVPAGTSIDSVPVDGTTCRFRTCYDVRVSPLALLDAKVVDAERAGLQSAPLNIELSFQARGVALASIQLDVLRLHINGDLASASDLYFILRHYLQRIVIRTGRGEETVLKADALRAVGFSDGEFLVPNGDAVLPAYVLLQEYFQYPQKFLFVDIDLRGWRQRGDGDQFTLMFDCLMPSFAAPTIKRDSFILHATPAVNLFPVEAEPVLIDHTQAELLLKPSSSSHSSVEIYSVDYMEGRIRGASASRKYEPFSACRPTQLSDAIYHLSLRSAPQGGAADTFVSFSYGPDIGLADKEIVVARLTCCNGELPERLMPGDVRVPTTDTPALVDFRNITVPVPGRKPAMKADTLWQLLSHLSLNYLPIASAENLRAMLNHYILLGGRERAQEMANLKRVEGIQDLRAEMRERLTGSAFIRGFEINMKVRQDHFSSDGDKYLFGTLLDYFFGAQAAINCFTALVFEDVISGEKITWPTRLGTKLML